VTTNTPNLKLLTLVVPVDRGTASEVKAMLANANMTRFSSHLARGALPGARLTKHDLPVWTEMEIIQIVVDAPQAQCIFEEIHQLARMDEPESGMLYQAPLSNATAFMAG